MAKSAEELEYELGYTPSKPKNIHPIFVGIISSADDKTAAYNKCKYELSLEEIGDLNELLIAEAINNEKAERVAKMRAKQESSKNSPV